MALAAKRTVAAAVAASVVAAGGALAAPASGVYSGGSRPATRHMDITLQVLHGGHRANWRIDVFAPCQNSDDQLDRTVGTDAGSTPPDPQLRIKGGRFTLKRHATNPTDGLVYRYTLIGHAVKAGFVGTFHYRETEFGVTCDSRLLHWHAHRSSGPFP